MFDNIKQDLVNELDTFNQKLGNREEEKKELI